MEQKQQTSNDPSCHSCHYSTAVRYDLKAGGKTDWMLYCTYWKGHLYGSCFAFMYEPGTDVQELPKGMKVA